MTAGDNGDVVDVVSACFGGGQNVLPLAVRIGNAGDLAVGIVLR